MELTFENGLRHNYLFVSGTAAESSEYETRILQEAQIPMVLPVMAGHDGAGRRLSIEVTSLISLDSMLENHPMDYHMLGEWITNINRLLEQLEEYFISEELVCLKPEGMFRDRDSGEARFVLLPGIGQEHSFSERLREFLLYCLKKIDYTDDRTVILSYSLYQACAKDNVCMADLMHIVKRNLDKADKDTGPNMKTTDTEQEVKDESSRQNKPICISQDGVFRINDVMEDSIQIKGKDEILQEVQKTTEEVNQKDIVFSSDYGQREERKAFFDIDDEGEELLTEIPRKSWQRKAAGLLSRCKTQEDQKQIKPGRSRKRTVQQLQTAEKTERLQWIKLCTTAALLVLIPVLVYILKGGAMFRRLFPLILILEIGMVVVTGLDYVMARLPED